MQQLSEAGDFRLNVLQKLGYRHRAGARDGMQHVFYDLLPVLLAVQKAEHGNRHDRCAKTRRKMPAIRSDIC